MKTERTSAKSGTMPAGNLDQRSSPRKEYGYRQSIAPITFYGMPSLDDLVEVKCKDISGGGMSFYAESPPTYKRVLVCLGPPSDYHYFLAEVVRISLEKKRGGGRYIVGCHFVKRIYL